jgi:hypothetical protein
MAYKDLQPQKVVLAEMLLSQNKHTLLSNMIANMEAQAVKHNALTDDVETTFTDLKALLDNSQLADDVDIDKINETLTAVNSLLSEAGAGANILAGMGQVYAELNRREETKTIDVVVNTASGILEVDLSFARTAVPSNRLPALKVYCPDIFRLFHLLAQTFPVINDSKDRAIKI